MSSALFKIPNSNVLEVLLLTPLNPSIDIRFFSAGFASAQLQKLGCSLYDNTTCRNLANCSDQSLQSRILHCNSNFCFIHICYLGWS